ncbi:hypothetical protein NKI71_05605 [Mesorhizobium sp. M0510]|uniref:hypothetical protein n=1 Tax=Mesorhizobium sp. M0510 TaxID=2956954 RepID=UPI003337281C
MSAAKKSIATTEVKAGGARPAVSNELDSEMAGFPAIFIGAASTAQGGRRQQTLGICRFGRGGSAVDQWTGDDVSRDSDPAVAHLF